MVATVVEVAVDVEVVIVDASAVAADGVGVVSGMLATPPATLEPSRVATATAADYGKVSLAVLQREREAGA